MLKNWEKYFLIQWTMNKILFDMDWTLYSFENWQYRLSKLEKQVEGNAVKLLQVLNKTDMFPHKLEDIKRDYWENFSLAFEQIFWLDKLKYFETVWDIKPEWLILNDGWVLELFKYLKSIWFDIYILSESPQIWIERVLTFLKVKWLISWIFSWQLNERKSNGLLYKRVSNEIWRGLYMVWDQVQSDIIMSKNSWYRPVYINSNWELCNLAEFSISRLEQIKLLV